MIYPIETNGTEAPRRRLDCCRYGDCVDFTAHTRRHPAHPRQTGQGWDGFDCPADCAGYQGATNGR